MNNRFLWFLLATILTVSCNRCKDECDDRTNPECPNYEAPVDACAGAEPLSADFTIFQNPRTVGDLYIETQYHVRSGSMVKVSANEEDAAYKWIIGLDTIYSREYYFIFSDDFEDQVIPLKLIVFKDPNLLCFPNDNGIDTLIRYVHVQPTCSPSLLGTYRVAWDDNPLDSFNISFRLTQDDDWPVLPNCRALIGRGLNGDFNDSCRVIPNAFGDNYLYLAGDYCGVYQMNSPEGEFYFYPEENKVFAEYTINLFANNQPNFLHKILHGRKIN